MTVLADGTRLRSASKARPKPPPGALAADPAYAHLFRRAAVPPPTVPGRTVETPARSAHYAAVAREGRLAVAAAEMRPPSSVVSCPLAGAAEGFVLLADRSVPDEVHVHRSRILAGFLRSTSRWHPVHWVAEKLSVTPQQVVSVLAFDKGCRYHCEVWRGDLWVRANNRPTRIALRASLEGAPIPATDMLPAAQEAMENSSGKRPDRANPWVVTGPSGEGHRGDGAPDCGAAWLRAKRESGFRTAQEPPTPAPAAAAAASSAAPTTPTGAWSAFAPGAPAPPRWSSGYGSSGRSSSKWRRTEQGGWAAASNGGGRWAEEQALRASAPAPGAEISDKGARMLAVHREQLRIGALSGQAASQLPRGVNDQGQVLFRTDEERAAKREREREQRRLGLRR